MRAQARQPADRALLYTTFSPASKNVPLSSAFSISVIHDYTNAELSLTRMNRQLC